jgi:gamma-polyglutamate biosynthesis protein CapA
MTGKKLIKIRVRGKKSKFFGVAIFAMIFGLALAFAFVLWPKQLEKDNDGGGGPTPADITKNGIIIKEDVAKIEPVTLLAFGDLLLDRYIKREIDRKGVNYPFENIKEFLAGNDLVLANLEGSFTDFRPRKLDPNNTNFTFDPALAPMLKDSGFNIVNLANNHVRDFGKDGFAQSEAYLDKSGIDHFGDFYNEEPALIKNIRGTKIAFIGYSEFGDSAISGTIKRIKEAKNEADFVVVYAHWGVEYQTDFWPGSQEKGRQFIDAGADAVLGSHPHVVQPIEIYKGKPIFYSLGNFLFDQIFSDEVRHGLAVRLTFDKDKIEYDLYSTEINNFQVNPAGKEKNAEVLLWLSQKSVAPQNIKSQIATGKFIIIDY